MRSPLRTPSRCRSWSGPSSNGQTFKLLRVLSSMMESTKWNIIRRKAGRKTAPRSCLWRGEMSGVYVLGGEDPPQEQDYSATNHNTPADNQAPAAFGGPLDAEVRSLDGRAPALPSPSLVAVRAGLLFFSATPLLPPPKPVPPIPTPPRETLNEISPLNRPPPPPPP